MTPDIRARRSVPAFKNQPGRVPRLLVSVRDPAEAEAALLAGADLIDAKDPERGALGALAPDVVRAIVARVGGRAVTSAVADAAVSPAAVAAAGVDWVKLGIEPRIWDDPEALAAFATAVPGRLVAVLFAEDAPGPDLVPALAAAGFAGAMIDTAGKGGLRLTDLAEPTHLSAFTAACRARGLLCGLAGSLRLGDIPALRAHAPDYLGFRGGLCRDLDRHRGIDPLRVAEAVRALRSGRWDAA